MVPKLAGRGTSFKGAGQYYLHDKQAETSERVAWTEAVNLRTANPDRAIRVMAATALDRDALKLAAGIKAGGRSSEKVVQTYSLAWHPEQQPSKAEMVEAARESLNVLGLSRAPGINRLPHRRAASPCPCHRESGEPGRWSARVDQPGEVEAISLGRGLGEASRQGLLRRAGDEQR